MVPDGSSSAAMVEINLDPGENGTIVTLCEAEFAITVIRTQSVDQMCCVGVMRSPD
jgi:hypothetical protein